MAPSRPRPGVGWPVAAFRTTQAYDAQIVEWLAAGDAGAEGAGGEAAGGEATGDDVDRALPETLSLTLRREQVLRYGENPHQVGARYSTVGASGWWQGAVQHGGKELSYLNVFDADAAWRLAHSLGDGPVAIVVKHANPCGVALADDITTAYVRAHECDPVSAYGGIVAVNRPVTEAMAEALAPVFTEVLIAPGFEGDALTRLLEKRNLRVLEAAAPGPMDLGLRGIDGGFLVQTPDLVAVDRSGWRGGHRGDAHRRAVGRPRAGLAGGGPGDLQRHRAGQGRQAVLGIGCGQQNRRDAGNLAGQKADGRAAGGAYASDAFFPFPDGLDGAIAAGAATVIQPGGSIRDEQVVAAADEAGLAMVFTGERHFRH